VLQHRLTKPALGVALVLSPAVLLALLIGKYSVNVPYCDEWEPGFAGLFEQCAKGRLGLSDLFAQQNEARLFFPRLLFLGLGNLTRWDVRYEMAASFFLACLIALLTYRLAAPCFAGRPLLRFSVLFLSSLLIFSPVQWQAWLWGLEVCCYIPLACILAGLLLARSKADEWWKVLGCGVLCVVSAYSFGNGFVAWIVMVPALFMTPSQESKQNKRWRMAVWLGGFLLCEALYFHGYQPPETGSLTDHCLDCLAEPLRSLGFFLTFLGGPLAPAISTPPAVAMWLGGCALAGFAAACLVLFHRRADRVLVERATPWLALAAYSLLSDGLTTVVRSVDFGVIQALEPRYAIFGSGLLIATIHLVALVGSEGARRPTGAANLREDVETAPAWVARTAGHAWAGMRPRFVGLGLLGTIVCLLHARAAVGGMWEMRHCRADRLFAKTALAFVHVAPDEGLFNSLLYPDYQRCLPMVESLERIGYLQPPPFAAVPTNLFRLALPASYEPPGMLESMKAGSNEVVLVGWAISPTHRREADGILLTWEREGGQPQLLGLAGTRTLRPDLATSLGREPYYFSGWRRVCRCDDLRSRLPKGTSLLRAWSYDTVRQQAWPLGGGAYVETE
jgi:hypothetical protein